MPLIYKVPGYLGNVLLLLLAMVVFGQGHPILGIILGGIAGLNLFLIHKLDVFSREEVWLAHQLQMAKLQEELLLERQRVSELETRQSGTMQPEGPAT